MNSQIPRLGTDSMYVHVWNPPTASLGYVANSTYISSELISSSIALIPEFIYFIGMASSTLQDNFQPYKS